MRTRFRQEVLNVLLAQLLQERGVISTPENIISIGDSHRRQMPDVIVTYRGLRTAIEGEIDLLGNSEQHALNSARKRVEQGISHIGIAIVYPADIRGKKFFDLKKELAKCNFKISIITESTTTGFVAGDINYLETALRNAFDQLVREDIVTEAVNCLEDGIESFTNEISDKSVLVQRIADILGIKGLTPAKNVKGD